MATQRPISTVLWCSEQFLHEKMEELVKSHTLQAYTYIYHKGEEGDKDHIHLRIEPNKRIDPMNLTEMLKEYVIGEDKPRVCRPWRNSVEEDWILYVLQDTDYMKRKYNNLEKGEKIPYDWTQVVCSDGYDVETMFIRAKIKLKHTSSNISNRIYSGEDPIMLMMEGENVFTVNAVCNALRKNDYKDLQKRYFDLREKFHLVSGRLELLLSLLEKQGFSVEEDNDGNMILVGNIETTENLFS